MSSPASLLKKVGEMTREVKTLKKEKEDLEARVAAGSSPLTISALTAALTAASPQEMAAFISVMNRALADPEIRALVEGELPPTEEAAAKPRKRRGGAASSAASADAAAAAAAPKKPKKEASEAVLAAVGGWNEFVKEVKADLLASGLVYVKGKKEEELGEGEFCYQTLLKEAKRRNAELKGEEVAEKPAAPKKSAPAARAPAASVNVSVKAAVAAPAPSKKSAAAPPPLKKPVVEDEDEEDSDGESYTSAAGRGGEEDEDEDLAPLELDGVEYWLNSEDVIFEKMEFGGLGERIGVLDRETMTLVRD